MDREDMQEMVDDFIEQIKAEFVSFSQEMDANIEGVTKEMRAIGLSIEEDAFLMMNMVDPRAMIQKGQERCKAHLAHIYEVMSEFDAQDKQRARKMIIEALHEFHDELNEFLFPTS